MLERTAVFAAMKWECRPVLASLSRWRRGKLGDFRIWRTADDEREVVVVQTGIGPARARAAAAAVLNDGPCASFISTGCAGGLHVELAPGDIVIADRAAFEDGNSFLADARLRRHAERVAHAIGVRVGCGSVLCSPVALTRAAQKSAAAAGGHLAVEMEGAAIAASAATAAVPYLSVRAILDDAGTELHDGGLLIAPNGQLSPLELVRRVAREPMVVSDLLSVRATMQAAERSLRLFFRAWFGA